MFSSFIHLRAAGTSLVLDARGTVVPSVLHWGAELADPDLDALAASLDLPLGPSSIDTPRRPGIIPLLADGYSGQPGLEGFHLGSPFRRPSLRLVSLDYTDAAVTIVLEDEGRLRLEVSLSFTPAGILCSRASITNLSTAPFALSTLAVALPVPQRATDVLDFAGEWSHERTPQRRPVAVGTWLRESRHGRPGHDDSFLTAVGSTHFGFEAGEVWAGHLAWSGDKRSTVDATATGHVLVALGELLPPGEIVLNEGENYSSPAALFAHSSSGLNGLTDRFHSYFRSLEAHPETPRPLTLNTWEAVYFDHDEAGLIELARAAASVGVERFVLDDGWMTGRTDAKRALGDWTVDATSYPRGLQPLSEAVVALGMQFGLWVEPEMISLDSPVAREHPEWVLRDANSQLPLSWRDQHVMDLSNPHAFSFVRDSINALLTTYPITYLKWDMNRDLLGGSAHRHTLALYRLIDELRAAHPALEIESCASGGGRVDGGILERTQRVWASDTNDPRERQSIQRYSSILVPLEYLGAHVGEAKAHTTGRTSSLSYRLATALFGHAGIEWDLRRSTPTDRETIAEWASEYKRLRPLLHEGRLMQSDSIDGTRLQHGVVATDQSWAIFAVAQVDTPRRAIPDAVTFLGLDPHRNYRVAPLGFSTAADTYPGTAPKWLADSIIATGAILASTGLTMPLLHPDEAIVFEVVAL